MDGRYCQVDFAIAIEIARRDPDGSVGIQERVLRVEFIEYVICGLQEELRQRHETLNSELKELREEKNRIEGELKRLVGTIAAGSASPTVMSAINERKARIRVITDKLVEPGPDSLQEKLDELRTLAVTPYATSRVAGEPICDSRG